MSVAPVQARPDSEEAAIIEAYDIGLSYEKVARAFEISSHRVQTIMRKHSPSSIRPPSNPAGDNRPRAEKGLTLASLGLYRVGSCADCGTDLVSETQKTGQVCGFCDLAPRLGPQYFMRAA